MAKLAVYKYIAFMFLVVTILLSIFTLIGLFAGNANPATETALAMIVYVMPYLIFGNILILPYWLIRRRWLWSLIPTITLLCCIPYMGTLYQVQFSEIPQTKSGFKIASYNVALFGREISGFKANDILAEMKKQNVDIFCIQEYMEQLGDKKVSELYDTYFTSMAKGKDDMVIFSHRFPIKDSGIIEFGNTNNSGMWADIDINGKTIRVFNVHLETTGFNRTLRKISKLEQRGSHLDENRIVKAIYGNYTRGMVVRAAQSKLVASEIEKSPHPVIVCGDFNDVPYSFTYNTMKGSLVDGFKECGEGLMETYRGRKLTRIDYIFHAPTIKGESYTLLDLNYSDHNPVLMKLGF